MALKRQRAVREKIAPAYPSFGHLTAEGFKVFRGAIVGVCADGTIAPAGSQGTPSPIVKLIGLSKQDSFSPEEGGESDHLIDIHKGCIALPFDVPPTWADVGKPVYAIDDETVTLTEQPAAADGQPAPAAHLQLGTLAGIETDGSAYVFIFG